MNCPLFPVAHATGPGGVVSAIAQAFKDPDLRKKILITLALMILYRIGAQIPTPGVD